MQAAGIGIISSTRPEGTRKSGLTMRILLVLCCLCTISLIGLTPPFEVPDEISHFYRAFQIGDPAAISVVRDGKAGAVLPASIGELAKDSSPSLGTTALEDIHPHRLSDTLKRLSMPLDETHSEFANFSNTVIYSPLAYGPQAAAIAIGRMAGLGPLALLYCARIANAFVALLVCAWAFRLLPSGRVALLAAAFLPMTIYEFASASADGQVISSAFLYTAIAIRGLRAGSWTPIELVAGLVAGLVFTTAKFPYLPLLLLPLPLLLNGSRSKAVVAFTIGIPLLCGLAALFWLHHVGSLVVVSRAGLSQSNVADQIAFLRGHPLQIPSVVLHTLQRTPFYYKSLIGVLAWTNLPLPIVAYCIGFIGIGAAVLASRDAVSDVPTPFAAWPLLLAALSASLIAIALYLTWTPAGGPSVEGIQGRYFTPLLPTVLFALAIVCRRVNFQFSRYMAQICLAATALNCVICVETVIVHFKLFA